MDRNTELHSSLSQDTTSTTLRSTMLVHFTLPFGITLILVAVLMVFGIPFTNYTGSYGRERSEVLNTLSLVADLKKDRFKLWLDHRKGDAKTLCGDVDVVSSVSELCAIVKSGMASETKTGELRSAVTGSSSFHHVVQHLRMAKRLYKGYQKIQVADAATGLILASTDEQDLLQQISRQMWPIDDSALTDRILVDLDKEPVTDKPYMTISDAIIGRSSGNESSDKALARLILHIDMTGFVKPMLYTGPGLGETGEIVMVNETAQILMPLRYPLADGSITKSLSHELLDEPVRQALTKEEGIMVSNDYRGVPVLAAFRYIEVAPKVDWGIVVKRDQAEVFAPVWEGLFYSALIGMFGLIMTCVSAALIGKRLSQSIRRMTSTAEAVTSGNLGARFPVGEKDEMAGLCKALNVMVERLERPQKDV